MVQPSAAFARLAMVEHQLRARGIRDPRVLAAMEEVPRTPFVPEAYQYAAHDDMPLPIGHGQTISQPWMVAAMLQALELRGGENVLEVGAGSGYQAALLGRLARSVTAMEIVPELAQRAKETIASLGLDNVNVVTGDGGAGYAAAAPYDAIIVAAAAPFAPPPLLEQLAEGGRLVIPIGDRWGQELMRLRRHRGYVHAEHLGGCVFVPLVGEHGQSDGW